MSEFFFPIFFKQDSTGGSEIKEHVLKHALPLVGHRKPSNDAKRYAKRPLVVVYYSVDFSFDYRVGKFAKITISPLWEEASLEITNCIVLWFFSYTVLERQSPGSGQRLP